MNIDKLQKTNPFLGLASLFKEVFRRVFEPKQDSIAPRLTTYENAKEEAIEWRMGAQLAAKKYGIPEEEYLDHLNRVVDDIHHLDGFCQLYIIKGMRPDEVPCPKALRFLDQMTDSFQTKHDFLKVLARRLEAARSQLKSETANSKLNSVSDEPATKTKCKTSNGDAETKIIAELTQHHKYRSNQLNKEAIGCRELARRAGVSTSTVSDFFKKELESYRTYQARCRDEERLSNWLRKLNKEFADPLCYGRRPPNEGHRDDV